MRYFPLALALLVLACGPDDRRRRIDASVSFDARSAGDAGPRPDVRPDVPVVATCGNGMVDFGEDCDGFDLNGESCATMGSAGVLACDLSCRFDASACTTTGDATVVLESGLLGVRAGGVLLGVCDDSFDENDAIVACRTLGRGYIEHTTSTDGPSDDFFMDDLGCTGTETSLFDCTYNDQDSENCTSPEWVALVCE